MTSVYQLLDPLRRVGTVENNKIAQSHVPLDDIIRREGNNNWKNRWNAELVQRSVHGLVVFEANKTAERIRRQEESILYSVHVVSATAKIISWGEQ
jgi:hypothetical protein